MANYIDAFVIPLPKKNLAAYRRMAAKAGKIWREHGALAYVECSGDDLNLSFGLPFPKGIRARKGETIVFSWILYESRAQRDRINVRIMKDPRLSALCKPESMPFDPNRMLCGGFKVMVNA